MSKGNAADDSGIVAEMLKQGNSALLDAILNLFNDFVVGGKGIPSRWKKTRFTVIFKKGNAKLPSNYRPIAITPILYKLFSRMFCARIQTTLMPQQSPDQAAYRAGYSTEDHLLTVTLITELCSEWRSELWLGLIAFEKAFDTVEHDVLWEVLKDQGLHPDYIDIIKRLYDGQTAYVQAGAASRRFHLLRGVKQGDPVSALLFIAVMEQCFRSLKKRWKSANRRRSGQYFGIVIDDSESPLSNLRFADDILLFANSSPDLTKMIAHLRDEAVKYGLKNASRENENSFEYPARRATRVLNSWNYFHLSFEGRGRRKISWEEAYPGQLSCNRASEQHFSWLAWLRSRSIRLRCAIKSAIFVSG